MLSILVTLILTLIAWALPLIVIVKSTHHKKRATVMCIVLYAIVAIPLIWIVIEDALAQATDANIGLGLLFFFTWFMTILALIVALILYVRARMQKRP